VEVGSYSKSIWHEEEMRQYKALVRRKLLGLSATMSSGKKTIATIYTCECIKYQWNLLHIKCGELPKIDKKD